MKKGQGNRDNPYFNIGSDHLSAKYGVSRDQDTLYDHNNAEGLAVDLDVHNGLDCVGLVTASYILRKSDKPNARVGTRPP